MARLIARLAGPVAGLLCLLPGCRSSAAARLSAPDPSERAVAIVALADSGDASAVHKLVDLLEDRDRGVRMYANLALLRLCGRDLGYRYYDPEPQRAEAVRRWRNALRDGEVTVLSRNSRGAPQGASGDPTLATLEAQAGAQKPHPAATPTTAGAAP